MEKKYKGIIIEESIKDDELLKDLQEMTIEKYGHKLNNEIDTTIYKVEIDDERIDEISNRISKSILPSGFYVHFLYNDKMIVVYPNKIFKIEKGNKKEIEECIDYGISIEIEKKMLKFDEMFEKDHPNDKNAIIFGGSGSLGNEYIELLYDNGYSVYSTYNKTKPENIKAKHMHFDALESNDEFFENISKFDIKILIFCIGSRSSKEYVVDTDYEEFERLININAKTFLRIYKELSETLRKNKAKVLVVSSSASLENKKTNGAYSASKAYLDSISETLKKEEIEYGVIINVIHPTLFDSRLAREIVKMKGYEDFNKYVEEVLDGKIKNAKEIAEESKKYIL